MKTTDVEEIMAGWPERGTPAYAQALAQARWELEIGMRVRELRMAAGLSQTELARRVGTRQPAIARLEGGGGMPQVGTLRKIADALDAALVVEIVPRSAA